MTSAVLAVGLSPYIENSSLRLLISLCALPDKFKLKSNYWDDRKIPIKNVIVMTNKRPKVDFKHVKVLSLKELIDYIQYFDQTLDHEEVSNIYEYLRRMM